MTRWQGRIPLLVGVTGHRALDLEERGDIEREVRAFLRDLRSRLPTTPIVVLSRLAEGADQLVASLALAAGCESACVLPLELATYRAGFKSDTARAEFDRLFAASVAIELPVSATFAAEHERGYAAAGYYLAQHATILLAVWDGVASLRPGSTSDVVRARAAAWIGPGDPTVYHLLVRRHDAPAASQIRSRAEEVHSPVATAGSGHLSVQSVIAACGWVHAEEFNIAVSAAINHGKFTGRPPHPFAEIPDQRVADAAAAFGAASLLASVAQRSVRRSKLLLQSIAFFAAISFGAFLKFGGDRWLLWVYLALLAGALTVRTLIRRRALHRRYLDYRCLTEGLRVVLFWRLAGVGREADLESSAERLIGRQDPSLTWVGSAMAALDGWMGRMPLPETFNGCQFTARYWFGSAAGAELKAQIPYYRSASRHLRTVAARTDRLVNVTLITGVITAAMLAVLPAAWLGHSVPFVMVIMGFMPLVSGTASAAVDVPAEQALARQYECMADLFANAARRFAAASSDDERRQILFDVGTAALAEQRVWHAVFRQKTPESRIRA